MFCGHTHTELGIFSVSQIQSYHFVYTFIQSFHFAYMLDCLCMQCVYQTTKEKTAVQPLFISFNVSLFNWCLLYTYLAFLGLCVFLGTDKQ